MQDFRYIATVLFSSLHLASAAELNRLSSSETSQFQWCVSCVNIMKHECSRRYGVLFFVYGSACDTSEPVVCAWTNMSYVNRWHNCNTRKYHHVEHRVNVQSTLLKSCPALMNKICAVKWIVLQVPWTSFDSRSLIAS